ncbi:MAG TPA: hypothetical protein ENO20_07665 [Bacteroides sp.]|nr:hypothetical protein [Bacteroides sp.]
MKLLGGDMFILRPLSKEVRLADQVKSCLDQLLVKCGAKGLTRSSIYKAILFLNHERSAQDGFGLTEIMDLVKATVHRDMLVILLDQPPVQHDVVMEVYYFDPAAWDSGFHSTGEGEALVFSRDGVKISTGFSFAGEDAYRTNSVKAFSGLEGLLSATGFSMGNIVRQWNYIAGILRFEGPYQHYQLFNEARAKHYGDQFEGKGFPAATGIGTSGDGILIEYIAATGSGAITGPIDNPEQVPAYLYPQELLKGEALDRVKSTPKFERGRYLSVHGTDMVFVSGTAAIRGPHVVYPGNTDLQTLYTIDNIEQLIAPQNLEEKGIRSGDFVFDYIRVYLKDRKDYPVVLKYCREKYGNVPCVWIEADICRDELMVEIEGFLVNGHPSALK